jgi:hypothetical protein
MDAMRAWATANLLGGVGAVLLAAYAWALRNVCDGGCDTSWLAPLTAAPLVTLGTLAAWSLTGRRHVAWLVLGTAALAVPAAALVES